MGAKVQAEESISRVAFWPLWLAGRLFGTILFLSLFAVGIFVVACHFQWPAILDGEQTTVTPNYLQEVQRRASAHAVDSKLSYTLSAATYALYVKGTGIHGALLHHDVNGTVARIIQSYPDELAAGMIAAQVFGIRLGNVLLLMPFIILVIVLASIDGLTERMIRRACAGHESATVFRLTRRFAYKLLPPAVGLIYLCLPYDLRAGDVLIPALVVTAMLVRTKWKYYKKHV